MTGKVNQPFGAVTLTPHLRCPLKFNLIEVAYTTSAQPLHVLERHVSAVNVPNAR